jgi:HAD superfamily hydrolase (TIGR01549 family)
VTAYDAVVFDNDGVLVEPPADERQRRAARAAFADHGIEDVLDDHLTGIAGGVRHERLHDIADHYGLDAADLWEARDRYDQRFQREDLSNGVRGLYDDVDAIADLTTSRGIVSNNHHATVEFILDHFGLDDLFGTFYGRERSVAGLKRKKPEPHYIDRACADLDASSALYVGDRPSDVRAAHNAGIDSVFLRRDHSEEVELAESPTYEIRTLRDLPAILDGDAP